MYRFCVHVCIAKVYISAYMNLGVHIHTKDEFSKDEPIWYVWHQLAIL